MEPRGACALVICLKFILASRKFDFDPLSNHWDIELVYKLLKIN